MQLNLYPDYRSGNLVSHSPGADVVGGSDGQDVPRRTGLPQDLNAGPHVSQHPPGRKIGVLGGNGLHDVGVGPLYFR